MNRKILISGAIGLAILLLVIMAVTRSGKGSKKVKSQAEALYRQALALQSQGEIDKTAQLFQELIQKFPDFKQIAELEKKLWELNVKVLFSPKATEQDIIYKVEPGDTLSQIASRHNTTVDLIKVSNNLQGDLIRPGDRLKVTTAKYSVIVDKSQNTLTLKANDAIFKIYAIATGEHDCTPQGQFTIVEKLKNPDWYKSGVGIVPAASPENILGTRWLGLSEPQYGIHGGANKDDLGKQLTNGCVRMLNPEVEELFTILPRGSEVTIVE
ncbi:L,D-transpeptidase family protein [Candidatus Omnitrophota bacterium]